MFEATQTFINNIVRSRANTGMESKDITSHFQPPILESSARTLSIKNCDKYENSTMRGLKLNKRWRNGTWNVLWATCLAFSFIVFLTFPFGLCLFSISIDETLLRVGGKATKVYKKPLKKRKNYIIEIEKKIHTKRKLVACSKRKSI